MKILYTDYYSPTSSWITRLFYHKVSRLFVLEASSGAAYVYEDVPQIEWDGILRANSAGYYYRMNIMGKYMSERNDKVELQFDNNDYEIPEPGTVVRLLTEGYGGLEAGTEMVITGENPIVESTPTNPSLVSLLVTTRDDWDNVTDDNWTPSETFWHPLDELEVVTGTDESEVKPEVEVVELFAFGAFVRLLVPGTSLEDAVERFKKGGLTASAYYYFDCERFGPRNFEGKVRQVPNHHFDVNVD